MIKKFDQLIKKYDVATIFVATATVIVAVELSLMRLLVPTVASSSSYESGALMDQVYNSESINETSMKLDSWNSKATLLINRLTAKPETWQKQLSRTTAFGFEQPQQKVSQSEDDVLAQLNAMSDYCANQLNLQSIMTGRSPLANINGKIYGLGDEIQIRGGEWVMVISEIGAKYAVIHLANNPEIQRTIYLSNDMKLVIGDNLQ